MNWAPLVYGSKFWLKIFKNNHWLTNFLHIPLSFYCHSIAYFKAAYSVTFDLFILEIMFQFFKNTVKILEFRYTFYLFRNN